MTREHCRGHTKAGQPCGMRFNLLDGYCINHHPDRAEERLAVRRAGQAAATEKRREKRRAAIEAAKAGGPPKVGDSVEELVEFHKWVMNAAATRDLDIGEVRNLSNAVRVQLAALQQRDLAKQVKALERKLRDAQTELRRKGSAR